MHRLLIGLTLLLFAAVGCVRNQPEVVVITATFPPTSLQNVPSNPIPGVIIGTPTPDPTRVVNVGSAAQQYVVQPGDTLSSIAAAYGMSLQTLLASNTLVNPDILEVGQVINIPGDPTTFTSDFKIIPDARLVRGPGSSSFNISAFVAQQPGFIRTATDEVNGELLNAAQVVERVALEYSIDPRLLLALLEFRSGWLSNTTPSQALQDYPMWADDASLGFDRRGLYRQLAWASDQLNRGYYGWKQRGWSTIEFADGTRMLYQPGLNAGTVAIQYLLSLHNTLASWQQEVTPSGFVNIYIRYFGNPFNGVLEPIVPPNVPQPNLMLPFSPGQTWFYTGGPHGGWGGGSAWAAVDFAPPDELPPGTSSCYISEYFATAIAPGVVARTAEGTVILDLDGDGDESTGWTILYLHIAAQDRVQAGTHLQTGDRIGRPSCEGGFSNGTHLHIARRYNGEWIPSYCDSCAPGQERPPFVMNGWTIVGLPGQEYQGYMVNNGQERVAEQGRLTTENRVTAG